jgi:hypothetical protein
MSTALTRSAHDTTDPTSLVYPPTFPVEIALKTASIRVICEAYGIAEEEWKALRMHPIFLADLRTAQEMLRQEGMGFITKAKLQAEELLKESWKMIHSPVTPPTVRADLIKFTIRAAGLDQSAKTATNAATGNNLNIQINLG